jgi:hypothetical protein
MFQSRITEDPEPSEPVPAGLLLVPVRPGPTGCIARFFRTPLGGRTAVGFTTEQQLTATLGHGQAWIRLSESALRALATPLGVTTLTVDPQLSAPAPAAKASTWHDWEPQSAGAPRESGATATVPSLKPLLG